MNGLAQKSFIDREKRAPWSLQINHKWPLLRQLIEQGLLDFVDYLVVDKLLKNNPEADDGVALLICYLSIATRQGHLCVRINEHEILPDPSELWSKFEDVRVVSPQILQQITESILHGTKSIPQTLLSDMEKKHSDHFPSTPLCRFSDLYYFQKYWVYETFLYKSFHKLLLSKPALQIDQKQLENLESVLPEQISAIRYAAKETLTIISGGPGTGKTYTAGQLIAIFYQSMTAEEREKTQIVLAAPTGKAAANLQKSLRKALGSVEGMRPVVSKTLHSLLGIKRNGVRTKVEGTKLTADIILVDECSMIDVRMMGDLLAAVKSGARLILLGDHQQLPSVEAGSIFAEMIALLKDSEKVCFLKTCLRVEVKDILAVAENVNAGNPEATLSILSGCYEKIKYINFKDKTTRDIQAMLLDSTLKHFSDWNETVESDEFLLERSCRFRILTPLRKGGLGVDELNTLFFQQMIKKAKRGIPFPIPIMLTQSDSRLGINNGEMGILFKYIGENGERDYAIFPNYDVDHQGLAIRRYSPMLLPKYEYAYCMSVHKSQGSEFDHVLVLLSPGAERFGRESLYTAITRAKKKLEIWGEDPLLVRMIHNRTIRLSGLQARDAFPGLCQRSDALLETLIN